MLLTVGIVINAYLLKIGVKIMKNAFTQIVTAGVVVLFAMPCFAQSVQMSDLSVASITKEAKATTPTGQQISEKDIKGEGTSLPQDIGLAALSASAVEGSQHSNKCQLITIISPKDGANRDLGIVSVSDLAAGARVEVGNLVDEVGFAVSIIGFNPVIQLTEGNIFGTRVLFTGKSLDDFTTQVQKEGYTVFATNIHCQASIRQEDLASLAEAVIKARKALRALQD